MRWKKKEIKKVYKKGKGMIPKIGDIKIETKFAFFPVNITPTEVVWLEKYIKVYEYGEKRDRIMEFGDNKFGGCVVNDVYNTYNTWLLKKLKHYD